MSADTGRDAEELDALVGLPPVPADRTVRYGAHPSQLIDLYGDGPVRVVVLHGGFWRERYDRAHLSPFAAALAGYGMPVALAEYRRVGGGGGFPETCDDVAAALRAVPGTDPYVLLGHSAGGHLALWAASEAGREDVPGPAGARERMGAAVAVAPVADLAGAVELGLGDDAVTDFLGPDWRRLLADADPMRLPPPVPPVAVLHGTADGQVPLEQSLDYAGRAADIRLLRMPGVGHYAPFTPDTPAFTTLALVLRRMLPAGAGG